MTFTVTPAPTTTLGGGIHLATPPSGHTTLLPFRQPLHPINTKTKIQIQIQIQIEHNQIQIKIYASNPWQSHTPLAYKSSVTNHFPCFLTHLPTSIGKCGESKTCNANNSYPSSHISLRSLSNHTNQTISEFIWTSTMLILWILNQNQFNKI